MTAREYLDQYRLAQSKADRLKEKYDELRAAFDTVGGMAFTDVRPAGISKPTERKVERAAAALEKWRAAQLRAIGIRQNIYALLEALPCHESGIMIRRYVWLEKWEQIEKETGYSRTNLFKLHRGALRLVQELIDAGAIEEIEADYGAFINKYGNTWREACRED